MKNNKGFSKIEMLIAFIIITVLAFIAIPKFSSILNKSEKIATEKGLASLRNAIAIYYGDNVGNYPSANIANELVEKGYIKDIPYAYVPHHKKSNFILTHDFEKNADSGGWAYKPDDSVDSTGKAKGQIWINCSHDGLNEI